MLQANSLSLRGQKKRKLYNGIHPEPQLHYPLHHLHLRSFQRRANLKTPARKCHSVARALLFFSLMAVTGCTGIGRVDAAAEPSGRPETMKTRLLKAGAQLQTNSPLGPMNIYLVGFHPLKDDPSQQMEAHHFCHQVNEDFAQCALFDGNGKDANLNGIEYIISEHLFSSLPEEEKEYWHPHNGEILSGQLVAPGLPKLAEHELMKTKINSYGKTWHVWHTTDGADSLPLGEPKLAWSFNRDGEANAALIKARDQRMRINTEERRAARQDLLPLAKPQRGVDALKGKFAGPTKAIAGVEEQED